MAGSPHSALRIPNSACAGAPGTEGTVRLATGSLWRLRPCPARSRARKSVAGVCETMPKVCHGGMPLSNTPVLCGHPALSGSIRPNPSLSGFIRLFLRPRKPRESRRLGIPTLAGEVDDHGQNSTPSFFHGRMSFSRLAEGHAQKHVFTKRTQMLDINMRICNELQNDRTQISAKRTQMIHGFLGLPGWWAVVSNDAKRAPNTPSLQALFNNCVFCETNPNVRIATCLRSIGYEYFNK